MTKLSKLINQSVQASPSYRTPTFLNKIPSYLGSTRLEGKRGRSTILTSSAGRAAIVTVAITYSTRYFRWTIFGIKKLKKCSHRGVARLFKMMGRQGGLRDEQGADWESKWRLSIDICTKCNISSGGEGGRVSARGWSLAPCPPPPPPPATWDQRAKDGICFGGTDPSEYTVVSATFQSLSALPEKSQNAQLH